MSSNDSLLDVYIFENLQLLEQLEGLLLAGEKNAHFSLEQIDAIFRILHTIKGSSAMMSYDDLTKLSHAMEDLFAYIRETKSPKTDHRKICDLIFSAGDFIKGEIEKLQSGAQPDGDSKLLLSDIREYYQLLKEGKAEQPEPEKPAPAKAKPKKPAVEADTKPAADAVSNAACKVYKAHVFFQSDCQMENVRAFGIIKSVENLCAQTSTIPDDVLKEHSEDDIVANGFTLFMETTEELETMKGKNCRGLFHTFVRSGRCHKYR